MKIKFWMLGHWEIKANQFLAWQHLTQSVSVLGHTVYELITKIDWTNQKARNAISEVENLIIINILDTLAVVENIDHL